MTCRLPEIQAEYTHTHTCSDTHSMPACVPFSLKRLSVQVQTYSRSHTHMDTHTHRVYLFTCVLYGLVRCWMLPADEGTPSLIYVALVIAAVFPQRQRIICCCGASLVPPHTLEEVKEVKLGLFV